MVYAAEAIPSYIIKTMLDVQWNNYSGSIPEPSLVDVNDGVSAQLRYDLKQNDYIFIMAESPVEEEEPIGTWVYGNRRTRVVLELHTKESRQRLYDLKQEVRRICHSQMHSLTDYQRIQYMSFVEFTDMQFNVWAGRIILEMVNNAILLET